MKIAPTLNFKRTVCLSVITLLAAFAFAHPELVNAEVAEHLAHGGAEHHGAVSVTEFFVGIIYFWLNFAIFVGLLYWLLRKPAKAAWVTRAATLRSEVSRCQGLLKESQAKLRAAQARLAAIHEERLALRKELEQETEAEAKRIVTAAKERAAAIAELANETVLAERAAAERAVHNQIVQAALGVARNKLRAENNFESDRRYRSATVNAVQELVQ